MPNLVQSDKVAGPNGETVKLRFYDDRSIRVLIKGLGAMAISEAFLPVSSKKADTDDVIVKLIPLKR